MGEHSVSVINKIEKKKRVLTGFTPTATLTVGNYSVINQLLSLQAEKDWEIIVMVADCHALTTLKKNFNYLQKAKETVALLYAAGLKRESCLVFVQSQIPEHLELFWFFSFFGSVNQLQDMIQFKEKKKSNSENLSLLAYPVLMAADIFLYEVDLVVVGEDQKQHIEFITKLGKKINEFFGRVVLKIPKFLIPEKGSKILDLKKPSQKMSKSNPGGCLFLLEKKESIYRKIKTAITDSENKIYFDNFKKPGISNLLNIFSSFSGKKIKLLEKEYEEKNYSVFKSDLIEFLKNKFSEIEKNFALFWPAVDQLLIENGAFLKKEANKKIIEIKKGCFLF